MAPWCFSVALHLLSHSSTSLLLLWHPHGDVCHHLSLLATCNVVSLPAIAQKKNWGQTCRIWSLVSNTGIWNSNLSFHSLELIKGHVCTAFSLVLGTSKILEAPSVHMTLHCLSASCLNVYNDSSTINSTVQCGVENISGVIRGTLDTDLLK